MQRHSSFKPADFWPLFFVVIILLLAACGSAAPQPTPTTASLAVVKRPSVTPTALAPTDTAEPTNTPRPTSDDPDATQEPEATPTSTPTAEPSVTASPTSRPVFDPTLDATVAVGYLREGEPTPAVPIPTAVPTFEIPKGTTNILLLGSDDPIDNADAGRTDTMMIVTINPEGPTASMISLPRDLYVYIPGFTMNRLNTAMSRGDTIDYPGGGIGMLEQTILYNFGIPIHYYAQVDFQGFQDIVDAMGGVDLAVSCERSDWRLKSPELYVEDPDNWEVFTLEPGVHHMDGDLALWYARSRLLDPLSDWGRSRRQQQLLRAMFNQGLDLGLLSELPTLWNTYRNTVDTDMDIGKMLQLATLAPAVRENGIQNLYLAGKTESLVTPGGAAVQIPKWEGQGMMAETFQQLFQPPALNRAARPPITVEIINATGNPDMGLLAADNLSWFGFAPVFGSATDETVENTQISYYKPNFKESYDWLIAWIFDEKTAEIELASDDDYEYDYRVVLGEDYDPCRPQLYAPQPDE
ncbi:MAG: LCP family protein [Anaerolineae bacterium]|nr:LCP family protein [Anaerolineae bacterium]